MNVGLVGKDGGSRKKIDHAQVRDKVVCSSAILFPDEAQVCFAENVLLLQKMVAQTPLLLGH